MNIVKITKNIFRNLGFTLKNIPKKSITINYPLEKRELPERLPTKKQEMRIVLPVNFVKEFALLK